MSSSSIAKVSAPESLIRKGKHAVQWKRKTLYMVMENATSTAKEKLLKESACRALKPRKVVQQSWHPDFPFIFYNIFILCKMKGVI